MPLTLLEGISDRLMSCTVTDVYGSETMSEQDERLTQAIQILIDYLLENEVPAKNGDGASDQAGQFKAVSDDCSGCENSRIDSGSGKSTAAASDADGDREVSHEISNQLDSED